MATYLDTILESHRFEARKGHHDLEKLQQQALAMPATRGFTDALRLRLGPKEVGVISEIKRRSPSKGDLAVDLDPARLAAAYARGGASAISVLTDAEFFGGSESDLYLARMACGLPVLRKDFIVSEADVYKTRIMGADAILLIVAALSDAELRQFHDCAVRVGLDVLVEVHDESELQRALNVGATMIGVNQRDLHTFAVDRERARRVGALIPDGLVRVAESGIATANDVDVLRKEGFHAILVGEALVTAEDPAEALKVLQKPSRTSSAKA